MSEQLISEEYVALNAEMHAQRDSYGRTARHWITDIEKFVASCGCSTPSILDYGCGKGELSKAWSGSPVEIINYDPAMERWKEAPSGKYDYVICVDVLEHIEPDKLANVLAHIRESATKGVFYTIATRPAHKLLPDGRNPHLIQRPWEWWFGMVVPELWKEIRVRRNVRQEGELVIEIRL